MGSQYDAGGRRWDIHLFLDHDGRYERVIRRAPDYERRDTGQWSHNEAENLLLLEYDAPDEFGKTSDGWWLLAVKGCEDSNVLMVLRAAILASRNLPIVFYRVNCNDLGCGSDWQQKLAEQQAQEETGDSQ
jgi:hypothetical protein